MAETPRWPPEQLERYPKLLHLRVRQMQLDPRFRRRFSSSDLVQEALVRAVKNLNQCHAPTEAALIKWLEKILTNVVIDEIRKHTAKPRNVWMEQHFEEIMAQSSARLEKFLEDNHSSPVEQAQRHELLLHLADAMDRLPEDQRDVIIQHQLLGMKVADVAAEMTQARQRPVTPKAVAGLFRRGIEKLRTCLNNDRGGFHDVRD